MKYNPTLDGVRGVAIILVLIAHFDLSIFNSTANNIFESFTAKFGSIGTSGVDLFFILSGYLITNILLNTKEQKVDKYYMNFYARRFLRIFPLYYGVLMVILIILPNIIKYDEEAQSVFDNQKYLWSYLSNLSSTGLINPHWDNSKLFHVGHFWSLAVEEQFYFIWPTVIYFSLEKDLKRICITLLILSVLSGLFCDFIYSFYGVEDSFIKWSTVSRGGALAIGALLCLQQRNNLETVPSSMRNFWYFIPVLIFYLIIIIIPRRILYADNHIQYYFAWLLYYYLLKHILLTGNEVLKESPIKILNNKILIYIGTISYGLYVFHGLLRPIMNKLIQIGSSNFHSGLIVLDVILFFLLYSCVSIAIAAISYRFYEKPFLRLKRYFQ